jgi:hypothetical protein
MEGTRVLPRRRHLSGFVRQVKGCPLSVGSCRRSGASGSTNSDNGHLSADNGQRTTDHGQIYFFAAEYRRPISSQLSVFHQAVM